MELNENKNVRNNNVDPQCYKKKDYVEDFEICLKVAQDNYKENFSWSREIGDRTVVILETSPFNYKVEIVGYFSTVIHDDDDDDENLIKDIIRNIQSQSGVDASLENRIESLLRKRQERLETQEDSDDNSSLEVRKTASVESEALLKKSEDPSFKRQGPVLVACLDDIKPSEPDLKSESGLKNKTFPGKVTQSMSFNKFKKNPNPPSQITLIKHRKEGKEEEI